MSRALVIALLLVASLARADERPWADGVPEPRQAEALQLFASANDRYSDADYAEAVRLYGRALAAWDHPALHGNLAMALAHLDDPVRAFDELELALRYGAAPFDEPVYRQLVTSRKLLLGQLARVSVTCDAAGAAVTLDSRPLLEGAGVASRYVRIGVHEIVARKPDHLTFTQRITALPDAPTDVRVVLVPLSLAGGYEHRYATWKPWVVVAGSVVLLAVGVGLEVAARNDLDAYERQIARSCPNGCVQSDLPGAVQGLVTTAHTEHAIAITALSLGGVGLVSGGVLAWLNRPRRIHLDEDGRRIR